MDRRVGEQKASSGYVRPAAKLDDELVGIYVQVYGGLTAAAERTKHWNPRHTTIKVNDKHFAEYVGDSLVMNLVYWILKILVLKTF